MVEEQTKQKFIEKIEYYINEEGKTLDVHYDYRNGELTRIFGKVSTVLRANVPGQPHGLEQPVTFRFELATKSIPEAFELFEEAANKELKNVGREWEMELKQRMEVAKKAMLQKNIQILDPNTMKRFRNDMNFRGWKR